MSSHPGQLFITPDDDEPLRVEKTVSRLRIALAVSGLIAVTVDPTQPALYAPLAYAIVVAYALVAVALLLSVPRTVRGTRVFAIGAQILDVFAGAAITLFTDGPNSPFYVFLTFPLLTAAYRWSTTETLLSAGASLLALGIEAVIIEATLPFATGLMAAEIEVNRLIVRTAYLVISGIAIGYLADKEKQYRRESSAIAALIRSARVDAGLSGTLHGLMAAIGRTFESSRILLVVQEQTARRTFLLDARLEWRNPQGSVMSAELEESERGAYLFPAPGHTWYAMDRSPLDGFSVTAVDEQGQIVPDAEVVLPFAFTSRHRCRSMLAVDIREAEWTGRLLLLNPQVGLEREESVRFAQRLVRDIGPAVRQTSVIHRLRRRAERIERLRLARELHDGPIQTLSATVLQLELMQRRANDGNDPQMTDELKAVQALLRDEINNIRDMTQEMRLGLLESDSRDLVRELGGIVERFSHQHGVVAHFVSDEDFLHVSALARSEVLRALHEALVNIRKHSGASETLVWLRVFADRLILSIEDNGRGFPFDGRLTHRELEARGVGPVVIRERLAAIGGELAVESRPGRGARLEFRLPVSAHAHELPYR
jgi:signal transduction histidine kinase